MSVWILCPFLIGLFVLLLSFMRSSYTLDVVIYISCKYFLLFLIGCQRNCFWLGTQQCPLTFPHALLSCLIFFLAPKCHIRKKVWCLRKYLANDKTSYIFNFYCILSCIDLHPTSVPSYLCRDLNWKSGFLDQFPTSSLSVPWLLPRFWNLHFYNWNNNIIIGKKKKKQKTNPRMHGTHMLSKFEYVGTCHWIQSCVWLLCGP